MRDCIVIVVIFVALLLLWPGEEAEAQSRPSLLKNEIGLVINATSPFPGTELEDVLRANIGLGAIHRWAWPAILFTELGFSWSFHDSETEQNLTYFPLFLALGYRYNVKSRLSLMFKMGGGAANLQVRPANKSGWEPLFYSGFEASILATPRLRIGLRLDYNYVYEKDLDPPAETAERQPLPPGSDSRFAEAQDFKIINGQFFHFGLTVLVAY